MSFDKWPTQRVVLTTVNIIQIKQHYKQIIINKYFITS